ncbi:methionine--tRNA ligase [Pontibacter sp. G13]|uniref:methionine--tRNA ligase n=1 Tax=Pontibacter sp. G13 TaxID=3074898 RepID=UPI0028893404|nr:methionine--tRNA ligase [Pontibacter sp. G13]WNJ16247.1 methionine--tRNA ligase [Pontibacter sp. G13]
MNSKRYTITSALPYANGPLHIGHIAGAYLPADIYVRYLRMSGKEVVYICGSDEHGAAITLRAKKEGITPNAIIDRYHELNKETFKQFGIDFDIYHRTSEPLHHQTAQEFFTTLYDKGEFSERVSEQFYDETFNQFLADRYVKGTCPKCGYENAYGDQCENCGTSLSPTDLIDPKSTLSGNTPVLRETKHWYLQLDKYQPWLEEWLLEGKKGKWKNNVYGQCSSWLKEGLQPRSMTRDLDWGVDVPLDEAEGKKLYVWLDAPIGYISATKQWAEDTGNDWTKYWLKQENDEDDATLIHFIGKDNIVFHCIIFPSILHAHGGYILPDNVPANEFLNLEGDKMSTSRNHAVWLHEYLEDFPGKRDVLRYVLCAIMPENKDADFTWKDFQARNNNELVAILGNFVNRVVVLNRKYFQGQNQAAGAALSNPEAQEALAQINEHVANMEKALSQFRFREAQAEYMNIARVGNKYITDQEPWKKWKESPEAVAEILFVCTQIVAKLGVFAKPFLPDTADTILDLLKAGDLGLTFEQARAEHILIPEGHQMYAEKENRILFEKIEDEVIQQQLDKLANAKAAADGANVPAAKEEVTFDDFQTMDIRIGTILEAEKVKKAKKLLQFKVDTGIDVRTIVSGVAEFFSPEEMVGKQVPVLVNLKPRKIRGVESQGMILFAEDLQGKLHILDPKESIDSGSSVN